MKSLSAPEKFTQIYKKNPEIVSYSGYKLSELLGVSHTRARDIKYDFIRKHNIKIPKEVIQKFTPPKLPKPTRQEKKIEHDINKEILLLKKELGAALNFKSTPQYYKIPSPGKNKSFSTAVVLASDWHYEETVKSAQVSGLNAYNLTVADKRINLFFNNIINLLGMMTRETTIETLVLSLLGDFISGDIHDDIVESCSIRPTEAIMAVMARITAGIDLLIKSTDLKLVIPCHSGNHGRTTKEQYVANEQGHSLEWMMYKFLAQYYEKNKRITFIISEGYHTYLDLNGYIIRNHHGHAINYGGGVGGLSIPAYKAIANWNKGRVANLDCFGHLHTSLEGGNFVSNGSLIGYSPYSVKIKASFEKPTQTLFLINDKHKELTLKCKIFLEG